MAADHGKTELARHRDRRRVFRADGDDEPGYALGSRRPVHHSDNRLFREALAAEGVTVAPFA